MHLTAIAYNLKRTLNIVQQVGYDWSRCWGEPLKP